MNARSNDEGSLLHAIDLALVRDWGDAKSLAESLDGAVANRLFLLLCDIEEREAARVQQLVKVRHEIGNALSIAQANLEAIVDGLLEPTPPRLNGLLDALGAASIMLEELRRTPLMQGTADVVRVEPFNICALIETHVGAVTGLATAKNVTIRYSSCAEHRNNCIIYRGDATRTGRIVRNVLLKAIRYTPPGGRIDVRCDAEGQTVRLHIRDHHQHAGIPLLNKLLKSIGAHARLEEHDGEGENVLVIDLPAEPHHP